MRFVQSSTFKVPGSWEFEFGRSTLNIESGRTRKPSGDSLKLKTGDKFMTSNYGLVPFCFTVLLLISGCSGVGSDVVAGRNALQTGRPNDAVGYLTRAADADPTYKLPYRVHVSVLAYLGRAYLETGQDTQARQTLEKAVKLDKDDPLAPLYLGIVLLKTGERERGRKEIEEGLRAIDDTLEFFAQEDSFRLFWDPNMQIRNDIRKSLAAK